MAGQSVSWLNICGVLQYWVICFMDPQTQETAITLFDHQRDTHVHIIQLHQDITPSEGASGAYETNTEDQGRLAPIIMEVLRDIDSESAAPLPSNDTDLIKESHPSIRARTSGSSSSHITIRVALRSTKHHLRARRQWYQTRQRQSNRHAGIVL